MSAPAPVSASGFFAAATPWLPWVGGAVVLGTVGAILGVNGFFGRPTSAAVADPLTVSTTAEGYDCPGGAAVTSFSVNERVLALGRSDDGAYLAVRNPANLSQTVWVSAGVVTVDTGQAAIDSLDVASCPETTVAINTEEVVVPETETPTQPAPGPAPAPAPAPVDNPPTIQSVNVTSPGGTIYCTATDITLSATVADDKGVSSVAVTWSGHVSGSANLTGSGSVRTAVVSLAVCPSSSVGNVTFSFLARDTANQASATKTKVVSVRSFD